MSTVHASALALFGGAPVRGKDKVWHLWPVRDERECRAVHEVLESGQWWYGERVRRFEEEYAAFHDAQYAVAVNSGTAALEIALEAIGLGRGDEVIVPAYTFIATASCVARMGGMPVFADVDETWCIDPNSIEPAITTRTKAIIPVHFGSCLADMDRINAIAAKHGVAVIEDACHSWGAKWRGKGTGALGLGGAFSFQMSKNITAGEGGILISDDECFADRARSIHNCGRAKDGLWYAHENIGTNARMTEIQAAILSAQLSRLETQTLHREKMAAILNEAVGAIDGLIPQPGREAITRRTYHLYALRIDPERFGCSRERFIEAAQAEGLPVGAGYLMPLYKQPAFQKVEGAPNYADMNLPMCEDLCARSAMWFPHQILLGPEEDMRDIITIFEKIKTHVAELAWN